MPVSLIAMELWPDDLDLVVFWGSGSLFVRAVRLFVGQGMCGWGSCYFAKRAMSEELSLLQKSSFRVSVRHQIFNRFLLLFQSLSQSLSQSA